MELFLTVIGICVMIFAVLFMLGFFLIYPLAAAAAYSKANEEKSYDPSADAMVLEISFTVIPLAMLAGFMDFVSTKFPGTPEILVAVIMFIGAFVSFIMIHKMCQFLGQKFPRLHHCNLLS